MKKIFLSILIIAIIGLLSRCNSSLNKGETSKKIAPNPKEMSLGFDLLESNCFSCHNPKVEGEQNIAPAMGAVKNSYITENTSQKQFVKDIKHFVLTPNKSESKMPDAVGKFGLMPTMNFSEKQLKAIAIYIYNTELEKPSWYANNYNSEKKKHKQENNSSNLTYTEMGMKAALATKSVLGKNLLGAIKANGTENALAFCNEKAIILTDSMSSVLNKKIKRVSDKNRNPNNKANQKELDYILKAKQALSTDKKIKPQMNEIDGKMVGYYPIVSNKMCLQCHGSPNTNILPKTMTNLEKLYPEDLATGYDINELRGIWVVEMDKK